MKSRRPLFWKVNCEEDRHPGMWQRWFRQQTVAIGWPPGKGFRLNGKTKGGPGWKRAREVAKRLQVGDVVIATLQKNRVGRIGVVTGTAIEDDDWKPLVPRSRDSKFGEKGRRIFVRWNLTVGPDDRDMVVALPVGARLSTGELRPTITEIKSRSPREIKRAMDNELNWVGLLTYFDYERALSGFIAAYPHKLEDGLLPHPDKRVRERIFRNKTRSDVLLEDRNGNPVVVECKQGMPTTRNLKQLRDYMKLLAQETKKHPRGILVHGGSRKLSNEIAKAARRKPSIEIVRYSLDVDFARSV